MASRLPYLRRRAYVFEVRDDGSSESSHSVTSTVIPRRRGSGLAYDDCAAHYFDLDEVTDFEILIVTYHVRPRAVTGRVHPRQSVFPSVSYYDVRHLSDHEPHVSVDVSVSGPSPKIRSGVCASDDVCDVVYGPVHRRRRLSALSSAPLHPEHCPASVSWHVISGHLSIDACALWLPALPSVSTPHYDCQSLG